MAGRTYLFILFLSFAGSFKLFSQSWEAIQTEYAYVYDIQSLNNTLYITGRKGNEFVFAFSQDFGSSWTEVGLDNYISLELGIPISVDFFSENHGILGVKGNLTVEYFQTHDGGLTWHRFEPNMLGQCQVRQPWTIEMVNDSVCIISAFQNGGYMISKDGGQTWDCNYDFGYNAQPTFTIINDSVFYTCSEQGFYRSVNVGETWSEVLSLPDFDLVQYSFLNDSVACLVTSLVDEGSVLYLTEDKWASYDTISLPAFDTEINSIAYTSENDIFLFAREKIYHSTDGGRTFPFLQSTPSYPTHSKNIEGTWYSVGRNLLRYNPNRVVTNIPSSNAEIVLFPNPIRGSAFYLNRKEVTYELYDMQGAIVAQGNTTDGVIQLNKSIKGLFMLWVIEYQSGASQIVKVLVE